MGMTQLDFVGGIDAPSSPRILGNTRPSVAEEKASLCLELGRLLNKVPASIASGSIQKTREWMEAQKAALKLVKNVRAAVPQLTSAINNMRRFA